MDIQDLRIFSRVARLQNLSAVGAEFDLSAGTISKRLQSLEAELSVRLFDRTTRSICITEEGRTLLVDVERILADLDGVLATLSENVERPRGRLRISAPTSLGRNTVAAAIATFMKRYPEIDVHVDLTDRVVPFPDGGYDVALRTGHLADSSLIAKRLAPDPQVVVASPAYLARHGAPRIPAELSQHACLVLGDAQHWVFRNNGATQEVRVVGRLRSDDGELLRHAAIEALGILKISRTRVADDIEAGKLVEILSAYDVDRDAAIWAVYPSNRHLLPKLRVFLEFLSSWFRDDRRDKATAVRLVAR